MKTHKKLAVWWLAGLIAAGMLAGPATGLAEDDGAPATAADAPEFDLDKGASEMTAQPSIGPRLDPFTEDEWAALDKRLDHTTGYDQQAFYVLLKYATTSIRPEDAKEVTVQTLHDVPESYRGRPVRLQKLLFKTGQGFDPPRPEPFRTVFSTSAAVVMHNGQQRAVFVISSFPPPQMRADQQFEVVGYFFKLLRATAPDGTMTSVPVIIARHINVTDHPTGGWDRGNMFMMMAVAGLIIVYIFVRSKISKQSAPQSTYRPRRFDLTAEEDAQSRIDIDPAKPAGPEDQPR